MTREKIDLLQEYLNEKIPNCPNTWQSFKETHQNAAIHTFGKKKNQSSDWFDENDTEIINLLKNKQLNRQEIQRRTRTMNNYWFLARANEAEAYHKQKKLSAKFTVQDQGTPIRSSRNLICLTSLWKLMKVSLRNLTPFQ